MFHFAAANSSDIINTYRARLWYSLRTIAMRIQASMASASLVASISRVITFAIFFLTVTFLAVTSTLALVKPLSFIYQLFSDILNLFFVLLSV